MYYVTIKNAVKLFLLVLIFQSIGFPQLKKLIEPNMVSSVDIFLDKNGNRYSTQITFKFNRKVIELPKNVKNTSIDKIPLPALRAFMNSRKF